MITLKSYSGKQCVYCNSKDTANVRIRGERELSGSVCKEHIWKLLGQESKAKNGEDESKA